MKKLFFTFIALLIVFFSAWGIKLRMPINRPNNVQGEQQVAWYETRYTAPTAEEEWTLDPEIPVNYLPVAGEDEVYMVLDDSGNIVGYRHRTQQEDGSWLWTDIEDPNAEHYEKVDGLDHIYKVTDKDGTSSYQQYVRNEDGSYAYVPVNENGVPLDDGADATTIDTTHYVHKSGNVYGLYNDNGVLTGYRERVKDGENYVWKVTDPPKSSTSDLQEWSEAKKDNANQGDLSADSGDGTQNSGNNGVIVGGSGAESSQIDNGDGTYTKTETNVSTKTEDGYCITYKTTVTSVYDTNGTLISTQKDGPYEVSREKLNVSEDPSAASAADTIDAEVARVSGKVSYDTTKAAELLAKLNADRASAGLGQLQMNTNSLTYKLAVLKAADMAIYDYSSDDSPDRKIAIGHSGNTRLYIIRNGKVNLITHDHTQAYELLQEGKIDSETYYVHDGRLKLTSGIGKIINPRIDTISGKLQEQDLVLMTTDGIHYALRPDAMSEIILNSPPEGTEATNALVNAAKNIVKYPDNMSAMLIYMPSGFL